MTDMSNIEQVRMLQSSLRASLGTDAGKEVIKWLEEICGWYDFYDVDPQVIQIKHGKRSVLATIKTLLELTPEQIVVLTQQRE